MKILISPHNVTLTKAIEDHIEDKLNKLDHFDHQVVDARVTLEHDHMRAPDRQFTCSVRLCVPGPDLFAEDAQSDLYTAIDLVVKKLEQQIRTRQSRYKARKHAEAAKGKQERLIKDAEGV